MKKLLLPLSLMVFCASLSGCLKSRLQVRDDQTDAAEAAPQPAHVQEVQPQGGYVIDEIKSEMTRLTGRVEDLERSNQQSAGNKDDVKKLEQRIVELEHAQASMLESLKKMQDSAPVADPTELLEKGKASFESGNYDQAIEAFSTYLKQPKVKSTEEATFLRAESYYALKDYKKAIVDYSKFPEKFIKSKRMPVALYKIGQSFEAMGMKEDAKGFYQELVDKYPKSSEAKKARPKLK